MGDPTLFFVDASTADDQNPLFGAVSAVVPQTPALGTDTIQLSPGQYLVEIETNFSANNPGANSQHAIVAAPGFAANTSISLEYQTVPIAGLQTSANSQFVLSVYGKSAKFLLTWTVQPTVLWSTSIDILNSFARPDKLVNPALLGYPLDGGMVREYCPVAMSALCTFTGSNLAYGGDICTVLLPPNTVDDEVFTFKPDSSVGNPLYVESARRMPQKYDGPAVNGSYSIWVPSGDDDRTLRSPTEQADHDWPVICISGKVNALAPVPGIANALFRVTVVTTYQFCSDLKCFPLCKREGGLLELQAADRLLSTFPLSSANGAHFENLKKLYNKVKNFAGGAWDFYDNNKSWINPIVTTGATMLAAL
jgi:hypothetical protein